MPLAGGDSRLGTHGREALDPGGAPKSVGEGSPRMVTDYSRTGPTGLNAADHDTVTDRARFYSSRKDKEVLAKERFDSNRPADAGDHKADGRTPSPDSPDAGDIHIRSDMFPKVGKKDFASQKDPESGAVVIMGTHQGAPGVYRCSDDCAVELKPGTVGEHTGDDSNIQDLMLGTVYSGHGGTHRMAGAFGVNDTKEWPDGTGSRSGGDPPVPRPCTTGVARFLRPPLPPFDGRTQAPQGCDGHGPRAVLPAPGGGSWPALVSRVRRSCFWRRSAGLMSDYTANAGTRTAAGRRLSMGTAVDGSVASPTFERVGAQNPVCSENQE